VRVCADITVYKPVPINTAVIGVIVFHEYFSPKIPVFVPVVACCFPVSCWIFGIRLQFKRDCAVIQAKGHLAIAVMSNCCTIHSSTTLIHA